MKLLKNVFWFAMFVGVGIELAGGSNLLVHDITIIVSMVSSGVYIVINENRT